MAIEKVRVQVNNTWTNLSKNASTGKWEGDITAPATTSFNQSGGYYPVTIEVTNDAGTVVTKTATDTTIGESLRLVVKELIKPVITLLSPNDGAYFHNAKEPIVFTVTDEISGSGINPSTVKLTLDGTVLTQSSDGMSKTAITNGYKFTYTPPTALSEGSHSLTVNVSDNDGNSATAVSSTYIIDSIPPTLNITFPNDGFKTNKSTVQVEGYTTDSSDSEITIDIYVNGKFVDDPPIGSNGSFSSNVSLTEGINTIKVIATDISGLTSEATVNVTLDTTVPNISNVTISPNPVDASKTVSIKVEVS